MRSEQDTPWQFQPQERTFLLYALLHLLTSASFLIFTWSLWGREIGIAAGVLLLLIGLLWYPWQLARAGAKAV